MFFEGDHDFVCLFRQEIYSTGLHRSKCTGSDMCQRAHASTRTHINKQDGTQLQVNIHQKDCAKNVFTSEN